MPFTIFRSLPRDQLELTRIPIIALSVNVMPSDVQKSLDIGMNAHIGKPLNLDVLIKTLVEQIDIHLHREDTLAKYRSPEVIAHSESTSRFWTKRCCE